MLIHTKPISKSKLFSAISYALITLLAPVISVATDYSSVYATDVQKNITFQVVVEDTPTLTMAFSGSSFSQDNDTLALDLAPGMTSASFGESNLAVTVGTSSSGGYNLVMQVSPANAGNENRLVSSAGNSIAGLADNGTTGYTASEFPVNRWGFKVNNGYYTENTPNKLYDTTKYYAATTDEKLINSYTQAVDATNNPNDVNYSHSTSNLTFATKIDKSQPYGTYETNLVFKATAIIAASSCSDGGGHICYNDNGASSTTTMASQSTADDGTTIESGDKVTLWASNYKRPGYGFLGWMTTSSPQADTKYYGPNEIITADGTLEGSGITLYANWLPKSTRYTMQTFTSAVCKNELTPVTYNSTTGKTIVSPNSFIALEDERDGNVYAVARLGMGWDSTNNTYASTACWMIENLRLSSKQLNGSTNVAINANNTNNPADNFVSLNVNNETWCVNGGEGCVNTNQVNTINTIYTGNNSTGTVSEMSNRNQNVYSYGNYYNWYSTTAGDGTWSIAANNTSADGDICPINWRLPRGGGIPNSEYVGDVYPYGDNAVSSDFYALGQYLSSNGFLHNNANDNSYYLMSNFGVYPFNFVLSGYYLDATTANRGTIGRYWSSTAVSEADAYYAEIYVNYVGPGTYRNGKVVGFAVRCMAGV